MYSGCIEVEVISYNKHQRGKSRRRNEKPLAKASSRVGTELHRQSRYYSHVNVCNGSKAYVSIPQQSLLSVRSRTVDRIVRMITDCGNQRASIGRDSISALNDSFAVQRHDLYSRSCIGSSH